MRTFKPVIGTEGRRIACAVLASTFLAGQGWACQRPDAGLPSPAARAGSAGGELALPDAFDLPVGYALVNGEGNGNGSVVGMWHAVLRLGDANGPVYDEVLEQFQSDGTEMLISNGLPPALGNLCVGVWKRIGSRTYRLRHMTWNWSPPDNGFGVPGTFAGHFELIMTLRVDQRGRSFDGTWSAKNFDLEGEHLPELDASGVIAGVRITAD
jgi:hypothetical protein